MKKTINEINEDIEAGGKTSIIIISCLMCFFA